jgi:hypothetical protein
VLIKYLSEKNTSVELKVGLEIDQARVGRKEVFKTSARDEDQREARPD